MVDNGKHRDTNRSRVLSKAYQFSFRGKYAKSTQMVDENVRVS